MNVNIFLVPILMKKAWSDNSWILLMSLFRCLFKELWKMLPPSTYRLKLSMPVEKLKNR
jgi:hypothetical protein